MATEWMNKISEALNVHGASHRERKLSSSHTAAVIVGTGTGNVTGSGNTPSNLPTTPTSPTSPTSQNPGFSAFGFNARTAT